MPVPARESVEAQALEPTAVEDLPSRQFTSDGIEWVVRLSGQTSTGRAADPGASLLHLTFYKAEHPLVVEGEALVPGESIDGLLDSSLSDVLSSARGASSPGRLSDIPVKTDGRGGAE